MYGASPGSGPNPGVVAGEVGGAVAAGGVLGLGLGYVAVLATGGPRQDLSESSTVPLLAGTGGLTLGYSAGSALGTALVGRLARQDHRAYGAYLGALAGLPISFGLVTLAMLGNVERPGLLLIPAFAATPAGAVIGYNLSPPCNCQQTSRHQIRLNGPGIGLRPERTAEGMSVALDVRLLDVRF